METILTYRRITVTPDILQTIRSHIRDHPNSGRTKLSLEICRLFGWKQANGFLRDMVCRSLLLALERSGHLVLPPRRSLPLQMRDVQQRQTVLHIDDTRPLIGTVKQLSPLIVRQVRRTGAEGAYRWMMEHYHYLGYCQPVGEHLKYIVYSGQRPIACLAFSSAPRHIGGRDRFIGWDQHTRRQNIHLLAYNTRFLILPWVRVPHLASHILGLIARRISKDWQQLYHHPIYYLETFVDTERFAGTCYKAANWRYLGLTTGRGKNDRTHRENRSLKAIYGYPLIADFRERLIHGSNPCRTSL
jgi:hypothetical protein